MDNIGFKRFTNFELPLLRNIPGHKINNQAFNHKHIPQIPEDSNSFSIHTWQKSNRYLYAIDLFNFGYYWEVHEVLEKIWLEIGKTSMTGIFIQGIIQLSVAMVKKIELNSNGVARMRAKAIPKLQTQNGIYLGIEIENLIAQFESFINAEIATEPFIQLHFD